MNERHVNLLLIADDETNHYCCISDFDRLVGSQCSKGSSKTYFCRFCLHGFSTHSAPRGKAQHRRTIDDMEKRLKEHEERCFAFAVQRTDYPDDPLLKLENTQKKVEAPFTVYADFESILKQLSMLMGTSVKNISLVLTLIKLFVVYLELNLDRGRESFPWRFTRRSQ